MIISTYNNFLIQWILKELNNIKFKDRAIIFNCKKLDNVLPIFQSVKLITRKWKKLSTDQCIEHSRAWVDFT